MNIRGPNRDSINKDIINYYTEISKNSSNKIQEEGNVWYYFSIKINDYLPFAECTSLYGWKYKVDKKWYLEKEALRLIKLKSFW